MTDEELKALVASLAVSQKETDRQLKETDRQLKETNIELKNLGKELGKQIGGLSNKFGDFTEGMALPSMSKILQEDFGMDTIAPRLKKRINGKVLEMDVFGYTNSQTNKALIVEVKSRLNEEAIQQTLSILERFPQFFPEHQGKALYGILAFVDFREDFLVEAEKSGLYLAHIHDDLFKIISSRNFQPKNFQVP